MDEPVDHRGAGDVVAEDLASLRWSALGPLLRRLSFYLRRWAAKTDSDSDRQTVPAVVDRPASTRARPIRPLAVDPLVLRLVRRAR